MQSHAKSEVIASLGLFGPCTRSERELIERLATITDVDAGVALCTENDPGLNFYVLVTGEACVTVDGQEMAMLGPGCGFGEIALLRPGGRRIATVVTTTRARIIIFSRPEFATLMAEVPQVARAVSAECRHRLDASSASDRPLATS